MKPELSKNMRKKIQDLFEGKAAYVTLRENTKEPTGTYRLRKKGTPKARVCSLPESGNYGIIPLAGFFILDLDIHKGTIEESILFFEKVFGVSLKDTLGVRTPSGGLHYYLRVPENAQIFNGSLRSYAKNISELLKIEVPNLDADIRSSDATGYVVGPGSYVSLQRNGDPYETPGHYKMLGDSRNILNSGDFASIPEISKEGLKLLTKLRSIQKAGKRKSSSEPEKAEESHTPKTLEEKKNEAKPIESIIRFMEKGLKRKLRASPDMEYHRQRAFVATALRCCYSDYSIAVLINELNINKDSYSGSKLPIWRVRDDLAKMRKELKTPDHTIYCLKGLEKRKESNPRTLEQFVEHNKELVATRNIGRDNYHKIPQAISIPRLFGKLEGKRKGKLPQKTCDAILIIDAIVHPLMNVGADQIVLAVTPCSTALNISSSRFSEALRHLREKNILTIVNRQRTGLAATYRLNPKFLDTRLTAALRYEYLKELEETGKACSFAIDRFRHEFVNLNTNNRTEVPVHGLKSEREEFFVSPELGITHFAKRYLKL